MWVRNKTRYTNTTQHQTAHARSRIGRARRRCTDGVTAKADGHDLVAATDLDWV